MQEPPQSSPLAYEREGRKNKLQEFLLGLFWHIARFRF